MAGKSFSLSSPLPEADGQQGLAPYDLAGGRRKKRKKRAALKDGSHVLADYWTHHAHGGPTHFAGADAIAWGTPGDFDRCVALVSEHMSPEQAKGYCNLRHKDALGYYPGQHAAMERGKAMKAPGIQKVGPHGYSHGWIHVGYSSRDSTGSLEEVSHALPSSRPTVEKYEEARSKAMKASKKADRLDTEAAHRSAGNAHNRAAGRAMTAYRAIRNDNPDLAETMRQRASSHSDVGGRHDVYSAELGGISHPGPGYVSGKSARNPRGDGGQFRTFQGELAEAKTALDEGRAGDAMELLGSARALAQTDAQRTQLSTLQDSVGRVQHVATPDIVKVGPHGFVHGWIKVGADTDEGKGHIRDNGDGSFQVRPAGGYGDHKVNSKGSFSSTEARARAVAAKPIKGDTLTASVGGKQVIGLHDGGAGSGYVKIKTASGQSVRVPKSSASRGKLPKAPKPATGGDDRYSPESLRRGQEESNAEVADEDLYDDSPHEDDDPASYGPDRVGDLVNQASAALAAGNEKEADRLYALAEQADPDAPQR